MLAPGSGYRPCPATVATFTLCTPQGIAPGSVRPEYRAAGQDAGRGPRSDRESVIRWRSLIERVEQLRDRCLTGRRRPADTPARRPVRLWLEQLEKRWLPSSATVKVINFPTSLSDQYFAFGQRGIG